MEVRGLAACELSKLLSNGDIVIELEQTLFARPFPASADIHGAILTASSFPNTAEFLTRIRGFQGTIQIVLEAWRLVPDVELPPEVSREALEGIFVRHGIFRRMCLAASSSPLIRFSEAGLTPDATTIEKLPRIRDLLRSWYKLLEKQIDSASAGTQTEVVKRRLPRPFSPTLRHVFVSSDEEGREIAMAIGRRLECEQMTVVHRWDEQFMRSDWIVLDKLREAAKRCDHAVFVLAQDNQPSLRGDKDALVGRNNMLFELGMFTAILGREATFIVVPEQDSSIIRPSNITGSDLLTYKTDVAPDRAVDRACDHIRNAIHRSQRNLGTVSVDVLVALTLMNHDLTETIGSSEYHGTATSNRVALLYRIAQRHANAVIECAWPALEANLTLYRMNPDDVQMLVCEYVKERLPKYMRNQRRRAGIRNGASQGKYSR